MAGSDRPRAVVFAPSPLLTITIEARGDRPELHLHGGGQGFWVARMLSSLGVDVRVCASFGGETGHVVRSLVEKEGIEVLEVEAATPNVAYVHDRRSGERVPVVEIDAEPLSRHEVDALYSTTVVEAMSADVCVLGGPSTPDVLPPDTYRRLAADVTGNGTLVVVDLSGKPLEEAVAGGASLVKSSHEDLIEHGQAEGDGQDQLLAVMAGLRERGAGAVVVSRAEQPALALLTDGTAVEVHGPRLEPNDTRGAGDSMTAGIAAGLAKGLDLAAALCLGAAAGGVNVTRRGLATGDAEAIERLKDQVELRRLEPVDR